MEPSCHNPLPNSLARPGSWITLSGTLRSRPTWTAGARRGTSLGSWRPGSGSSRTSVCTWSRLRGGVPRGHANWGAALADQMSRGRDCAVERAALLRAVRREIVDEALRPVAGAGSSSARIRAW